MRERLIKLLANDDCPMFMVFGESMDGLVDYLIANGVTIQKWIPVSERLPDLELVEAQANDQELYPCLVTIKHRPSSGGKYVRKLWYDGEGFVDRDYMDWTALVTSWMPLPEPPKEEE